MEYSGHQLFIDSPVRYSGDAWKVVKIFAARCGYRTLPTFSLGFLARQAKSITQIGERKFEVR